MDRLSHGDIFRCYKLYFNLKWRAWIGNESHVDQAKKKWKWKCASTTNIFIFFVLHICRTFIYPTDTNIQNFMLLFIKLCLIYHNHIYITIWIFNAYIRNVNRFFWTFKYFGINNFYIISIYCPNITVSRWYTPI